MEAPTSQKTSETTAVGGWFKTTHWTVVLEACRPNPVQADAALATLCQNYWLPIYTYVRRRGYGPEDAKDLTQGFFARLLEKQWLRQADPNRGKFRCFLLGAMNHFLANEWRRSQADRRGGGKTVVSLDDTAEAHYEAEVASNLTPEKLYERRWALSLFERALEQLEANYVGAGKGTIYDVLNGFLSTEASNGDYARAGAQLGMTPTAITTAVRRLRQRYRELVREEIVQTVTSPAEVEDEMRSLLAALG